MVRVEKSSAAAAAKKDLCPRCIAIPLKKSKHGWPTNANLLAFETQAAAVGVPYRPYRSTAAAAAAATRIIPPIPKKEKVGPRFKDFGGMDGLLKEIQNTLILPLVMHHKLLSLGTKLRTGFLFHGPPGCGKTTLSHAIANELGVPIHKICATEVLSQNTGGSEYNIRKLFKEAYKTAPSIVFIDEIDAIGSKREDLWRHTNKRIVTQLMSCMDECHRRSQLKTGKDSGYVIVIGATNFPDALDPALRRAGRFEQEFLLGVPDENARADILSHKLPPGGSFDVMKIARSTPGYVPADFDSLLTEATYIALGRLTNCCRIKSEACTDDQEDRWWMEPRLHKAVDNLTITMDDIEKAMKKVQPSSKREGFSTIPDVTWEHVGGLDYIRQTFDRFIVSCVKYPEQNKICGGDIETGFLLFGPPGCGKTLIAKAVANEAGANFIYIKGPELFNMWVGESERAVRTLFSRARACSPCVIFFDEIDSLASKRNDTAWGRSSVRVVTQLLTELDGRDQRQGVFVIGATNRIDNIDEALLRPGRLCKRLFVPLPSAEQRGLILNALGKGRPIDPSVNLNDIGRYEACHNFSGADLKFLMKEAIMEARDEAIANSSSSDTSQWSVKVKHFEQVITKISPSVSDEDVQRHLWLAKMYKACNI